MKSSLLDATCRVAFAGLIHDLGKFAQRARIDASEASIKLHQQMYCPRRQAGDRIWWTHQHAAYTALAFPVIEKVAPALIGEKAFPFSEGDATDSLINAASAHHAPQTFLQWIVATADRVASGFEREVYDGETAGVEPKNYIQTRQRALLEEVSLQGSRSIRADTLKLGFPLRPLSAAALFPEALDKLEDRTVDQASRKLFKSTLNNRLHRNLACVIDKSSRGTKLKRAFEELPQVSTARSGRTLPLLLLLPIELCSQDSARAGRCGSTRLIRPGLRLRRPCLPPPPSMSSRTFRSMIIPRQLPHCRLHFGDGTRKKAERMTMPFAHSRIGSIGMTTSFC